MVFQRKTNLFERILLPVAFIVGVVGFYMIYTAKSNGAWIELVAVFSWLILIFLMVRSEEHTSELQSH